MLSFPFLVMFNCECPGNLGDLQCILSKAYMLRGDSLIWTSVVKLVEINAILRVCLWYVKL